MPPVMPAAAVMVAGGKVPESFTCNNSSTGQLLLTWRSAASPCFSNSRFKAFGDQLLLRDPLVLRQALELRGLLTSYCGGGGRCSMQRLSAL